MDRSEQPFPPDREALETILESGALAPSGDNCQPWSFRARKDGRVELFNEPRRGAHFLCVRERASRIAQGAVLENMEIAAAHLGYRMALELFPNGDGDPLVARAAFASGPAPAAADGLYAAIRTRCTNRRAYRVQPLSASHRQALVAAAGRHPRASFRLVEEGIDELVWPLSLNEKIIFENRGYHRDLFRWMRWSRSEAESARDGLYCRTLELGLADLWMLRCLGAWPLARAATGLGLGSYARWTSYRNSRLSSAIGFVQMPEPSAAACLEGGRLLQRLWLTATRCGLSFQPMAGVVMLIDKLREDERVFSKPHRRLLREAEARLAELAGLDAARAPIMFFRIGVSPGPSALSLRRPWSASSGPDVQPVA